MTSGDIDDFDEASAGESRAKLKHDARLQVLGKQCASTLYMLIRNVKIHSPDNAIFLKPIDQLRETVNQVVALDRQCNMQAAGTTILLNSTIIRFDFSTLENITYLTKEFQERDVGGFNTKRPVTSQEIRDFLYLFSSDFKGQKSEEGAAGHELPSMRLARYQAVKDVIDKLQDDIDLDQQIDRKKYLMTVYARTVFFMRKFYEFVHEGKEMLPFSKAGRLIQDLVDLCYEQRSHFLGLTTASSDTAYQAFHATNCALMGIVFGSELGLDRRQLHELGMAALFSQIGLADVPDEVLLKPGSLSAEERDLVDMVPLRSAKRILAARGLDRITMSRVVAAYESKVDYALPQRDESGEIQLVLPKINLGVYGRIIAIVDCYDALTSRRPFREAYGPEVALALMCGDLKHRFDPVLLRIFMKVMAIQPIKILGQGESTLRIG